MASVVARHAGTYDVLSDSITLVGTGSNKIIVAVFSGQGSSSGVLSAADINGTQNATIEFTQVSDVTGLRCNVSIAVWTDAQHPGAGSATFNFSLTSGLTDTSFVVYEIQDSPQQTTPFFTVDNTVISSSITSGADITQNVVDKSGVLGLAYLCLGSNSFFNTTVTSSANIGNDTSSTGLYSETYIADTASIADNDEDFSFNVTVNSGTAPADGHIGVMSFEVADVTAPTFTVSPAVAATTDEGHTISATLDEAGTIYGVRLADGATAPTSAQVVAGTDASDVAAPEAKNVAVATGKSGSLVFSTASSSTAYDYYIVAEDDTAPPNLQASPVLVNATTIAPTVRIDSTDPVNPIPGEQFIINLIQASNATGKTVTFNGYTVTPDSQDINTITINTFPYPWELSTADSDFLTNYDLVVSDTPNTHTVQRQFSVPSTHNYFAVQGAPFPAESIFADDTGLVDGDKHWGRWLLGGQLATVAINGVVSDVDNGAQYEYRFRDETDGLWGTAATDTFNVGTPAAVSISLSLVDIASSAQASLTGLRWAWYDSTDENALGTPTDTGVSETTTAAGLLEIDLPNSALVAGQTGTLIIGDATGRKAAYNLTVA